MSKLSSTSSEDEKEFSCDESIVNDSTVSEKSSSDKKDIFNRESFSAAFEKCKVSLNLLNTYLNAEKNFICTIYDFVPEIRAKKNIVVEASQRDFLSGLKDATKEKQIA